MRRRRRNPAIGKTLEAAVGVTAGVLGVQIVPPLLFGSTGATGINAILIQGAVGAGLSFAGRALSKTFGDNMLVGSVASVLTAFLKQQFNIGSGGLSFYIPNSFPIPTVGRGPYLLNAGFEGSTPQMNGGMS